jgi:hypothetical protein
MTVDEQQFHTSTAAETGNVAQPAQLYLEGRKPTLTLLSLAVIHGYDGMIDEWIVRVQGKARSGRY